MNKTREEYLLSKPAEKTKDMYSFQKLMYSRKLPDDIYCGQITSFDMELIPDKVMRIYSRFVLIFKIKIIRGQYVGESVKISFVLSPYFLCSQTDEESEDRLREKIAGYQRKTLGTFRHIGVVVSHSLSAMVDQMPRTVGNVVRFTISQNGESATIDKLLKRIKTFDEMLEPGECPFDK